MSTKSREVIWSGRIGAAKITAEAARQRAKEAAREADRAEVYAWSIRTEGYGGPAQPSPTIGQCLNGGLSWLEVECNRCKTRASLPLSAIRRPRDLAELMFLRSTLGRMGNLLIPITTLLATTKSFCEGW